MSEQAQTTALDMALIDAVDSHYAKTSTPSGAPEGPTDSQSASGDDGATAESGGGQSAS